MAEIACPQLLRIGEIGGRGFIRNVKPSISPIFHALLLCSDKRNRGEPVATRPPMRQVN
jgi:hypothetical protein